MFINRNTIDLNQFEGNEDQICLITRELMMRLFNDFGIDYLIKIPFIKEGEKLKKEQVAYVTEKQLKQRKYTENGLSIFESENNIDKLIIYLDKTAKNDKVVENNEENNNNSDQEKSLENSIIESKNKRIIRIEKKNSIRANRLMTKPENELKYETDDQILDMKTNHKTNSSINTKLSDDINYILKLSNLE